MPLVNNGRNVAAGALAAAIGFVSAHTGLPDGSGSNEATGGAPAYARQAVLWGGAAGGIVLNATTALAIPVAAATYHALGLWSAVTGGTFYGWAPIGSSTTSGFGTADAADVTSDLITSASHGLAAGDTVIVATVFGGSLPAPLAVSTTYYVIATGLTTDAFKLSAASGGAAINITATGELFYQKYVPEVIAAQGTLAVATGTLAIDLTGV